MEKEGFIYIWFDRKRKMYYIGCHWGTLDDGYVCSSNRMRVAYRRRPYDFKRKILKRNIIREILLEEEYKWLQLVKSNELGKKYYNLSKKHFGHWSQNPKQVISMREKNTGKNNPMYGKVSPKKGTKISESTRNKIKEKRANQIFTVDTRKKMSESHKGNKNAFYGKKHTQDFVDKMSKEFEIIFPNGDIRIVKNLSKFCKEHSLSAGNMHSVLQGRRAHHNGYTIRRSEKGITP